MHEDLIIKLRENVSNSDPYISGLLNEAANAIESLTEKKHKPRKFKPPTLLEITEYCASRNNMVDPKKFYDYFSAGDWMDSEGKPVKNWKQKIITWEGRGKNGSKPVSATAQSSTSELHQKWNIHYDN